MTYTFKNQLQPFAVHLCRKGIKCDITNQHTPFPVKPRSPSLRISINLRIKRIVFKGAHIGLNILHRMTTVPPYSGSGMKSIVNGFIVHFIVSYVPMVCMIHVVKSY